MYKDLREIKEEIVENSLNLSTSHRASFQQKLMNELHQKQSKKKSYQWMYVAASIVLLIVVGIQFFPKKNIEPDIENKSILNQHEISLGTISPELKTIENYYINTINYQLSQMEPTKANKELFDGYLNQLETLTNEYKILTQELNIKGVNNNIINALIGNLQLRLQLLERMQKQLQEFKNTKQNDVKTI